jgi:transposase-like protein
MDPKRKCPVCSSEKYLFRGRKKIVEEGKAQEIETRYRCKDCDHLWKERVSTKEAT